MPRKWKDTLVKQETNGYFFPSARQAAGFHDDLPPVRERLLQSGIPHGGRGKGHDYMIRHTLPFTGYCNGIRKELT